MASKILLRKQRYGARTDREREILQAQITTTFHRHHADDVHVALRRERREIIHTVTPDQARSLDGFIEATIGLVDALMVVAR